MNFDDAPLLATLRGLTPQPPPAVRDELVFQLARVLDDYYVHLPQKRAGFAIDPVQRLELLRGEEHGFLRNVLSAINGLRDRHTTLKLPPPWTNLVAFLPFLLGVFTEGGRRRYVVTTQLFGYTGLPLGAEVTHWNGTPIDYHVRNAAAENQGANEGASLRLSVANLCIRPLAYTLMPTEDWVTVTYLGNDDAPSSVTVPWRFYTQETLDNAGQLVNDLHASAGVDESSSVTATFRHQATSDHLNHFEVAEELGGQLRWGPITVGDRPVAYVRLATFEVGDADGFVERMAEILSELPQDGLILDIRSNPGGLITAGQMLIRLLTRDGITSSPVAFRNTAATQVFGSLRQFAGYARSLDIRFRTGQQFSQALSITNFDAVPDYRYPGQIVLIVDGLCYSTSDFFAADFADNAVGTIIGVDASTGGGGANVWGWQLLNQFLGPAGPGPLVGGFDLNLALRRSLRTGGMSGLPVEDLGVAADVIHTTTRADLFDGDIDLLAHAAWILRR